MKSPFGAAALILTALLTLASCERHEEHDEHAPAGQQPQGQELQALDFTHFSARTELFVEFDPLVVGRASPFAAHLTRLSDYKPVASGKVTLTLSGAGRPDEVFEAPALAKPGIFRPVATPRHAGQRRVVLRLDGPDGPALHDLGELTVYPNAAAALKAQGEPASEGAAIAYLKEQQWQTEYALVLAEARALRTAVGASGTLRAPAFGDAQLTAPVAGQVAADAGFPRVGMAVKEGQVLLRLIPRLGGESDSASLDLALQRARLVLQQARRERERLEGLFAQEAVAEKRVAAARNEESLAQAELTAARRRAGQVGDGSGGIAIRAPISGTVAAVHAAPGAALEAGQPLLHIADTRKLWLEVRVAESDLGRLGQSSGASFRVEGFPSTFEVDLAKGARLLGAGSAIDPVSRTAPLLFEFANPDPRLRIGMSAQVQLHSGVGAGVRLLAVPASAVVDDNGQPVVYVQRSGEAFERRPVELGVRDGAWVHVKTGVTAGERVVSRGAYQVRLASTTPAAMGEGHVH